MCNCNFLSGFFKDERSRRGRVAAALLGLILVNSASALDPELLAGEMSPGYNLYLHDRNAGYENADWMGGIDNNKRLNEISTGASHTMALHGGDAVVSQSLSALACFIWVSVCSMPIAGLITVCCMAIEAACPNTRPLMNFWVWFLPLSRPIQLRQYWCVCVMRRFYLNDQPF